MVIWYVRTKPLTTGIQGSVTSKIFMRSFELAAANSKLLATSAKPVTAADRIRVGKLVEIQRANQYELSGNSLCRSSLMPSGKQVVIERLLARVDRPSDNLFNGCHNLGMIEVK